MSLLAWLPSWLACQAGMLALWGAWPGGPPTGVAQPVRARWLGAAWVLAAWPLGLLAWPPSIAAAAWWGTLALAGFTTALLAALRPALARRLARRTWVPGAGAILMGMLMGVAIRAGGAPPG